MSPIQAASPLISATQILTNTGAYGGGLSNGSGSPTIQNNTFTGNSAGYGGGVSNDFGSSLIQNNTFTGNLGGVYIYRGCPTIRSNIIANSIGTGIYSSGDVPALDYNDVWNSSEGNYFYGVAPGAHDISADPLFVDAAHGDFHLSDGSPCIDVGNPHNYPLTDFEGDLRPMGWTPDIGADETPYGPVLRYLYLPVVRRS